MSHMGRLVGGAAVIGHLPPPVPGHVFGCGSMSGLGGHRRAFWLLRPPCPTDLHITVKSSTFSSRVSVGSSLLSLQLSSQFFVAIHQFAALFPVVFFFSA